MRYREIHPVKYLARFVECFWTLEGEVNGEAAQPERILPDGCIELILNFGASVREVKANGEEQHQPLTVLVGQMTRPVMIAPSGVVQLLGIRFQPGGTFPFLRLPMHELTNQVVELKALSAEFERDLLGCAKKESELLSKVASIQNLLGERVRGCKHESWLTSLAAQIVQRGGQISIDRLAADAGVSGRQMERRFLCEVGLSPKQLCRILRFQQIFRALNHDEATWATVAVDCGYYDQAHLIRDFRQFAGLTPAALLQHSSALTEYFTRKRRTSHLSNTALAGYL